jgi:hypothetical protein
LEQSKLKKKAKACSLEQQPFSGCVGWSAMGFGKLSNSFQTKALNRTKFSFVERQIQMQKYR